MTTFTNSSFERERDVAPILTLRGVGAFLPKKVLMTFESQRLLTVPIPRAKTAIYAPRTPTTGRFPLNYEEIIWSDPETIGD